MNYNQFVVDLHNTTWLVILVAARILGLMLICPVFDKVRFSMILKVCMSLVIALCIFPYFLAVELSHNSVGLSILLIKELLVGVMIGFLSSLPFWLVENAVNLVDISRGEQFGALQNPMTGVPSSSIAKLTSQGFITYLLSVNWLLFMFNLVFDSFKLYPINKLLPSNPLLSYFDYLNSLVSFLSWIVILALPVIIVLFIIDIILGMVNTMLPQLNATVFSMPLKSIVAIFLMIFYIGKMYHVVIENFISKRSTFLVNVL